MSSDDKKRKRGLNFTLREVFHLFNIAMKYKTILENKQTNSAANNEKNDAWEKITKEYNATSSDLNNRSTEQLKRCFDNKKQNVRKKKAQMRQEALKTGRGLPPPPADSKFDELDNLVLALMDPLAVEGHSNKFDSDNFGPILEGTNLQTNPAIEFVFENSENNILFDKANSDQGTRRGSGEFQEDAITDLGKEQSSPPQSTLALERTWRPLSNDKEEDGQPSLSSEEPNDYFKEEFNDSFQIEQETITCLENGDSKVDLRNYKTNDLKNPTLVRHNMEDEFEIQEPENSKMPFVDVNVTDETVGHQETARGQRTHQARRGPDRRRPSAAVVKTMTSSALAKKYEFLADKKIIIAEHTIKKLERERLHAEEEHRLRKKCLELDIEIRKKQLEKLARL